MVLWRLTALSDKAKTYPGPHGCDLVLDARHETRIGRMVNGDNSYCLPADWVQISSRHAALRYDEQQAAWLVVDSSTNGTFINGKKVDKGVPTPLYPGDKLRLSVVPANEPTNLFEYKLEAVQEGGGPDPAVSAVQLTPGGARKRKEVSNVSESMPAGTHKKARAGAGAGGLEPAGGVMQEVLQLQRSNQELRHKLEEANRGKEAAEAALKEEQAAHQSALASQQARAADEVAQAKEDAAAELAEAQAARRAAEAAQANAAEEATRLGAEVERVCGELHREREEREAAAAAVEGERVRCEALAAELKAEREARARAEEAREAAAAQVAQVQGELEAQQAAVAETAAALAESEAAKAEAQQLAQRLQQELQAAQGRAQSTEQHAQQLGAEGAELRGEVQRLVRLVEEGQVQLAAERGALGEARRQLESMALREQELQEKQVVVKACIQHIKHYSEVSRIAKNKLDQSYRQVEAAKAEADDSYDAMMVQINQFTEHLGDADSHLCLTAPAGGGEGEGGRQEEGTEAAAAGSMGGGAPLGTAAIMEEEAAMLGVLGAAQQGAQQAGQGPPAAGSAGATEAQALQQQQQQQGAGELAGGTQVEGESAEQGVGMTAPMTYQPTAAMLPTQAAGTPRVQQQVQQAQHAQQGEAQHGGEAMQLDGGMEGVADSEGGAHERGRASGSSPEGDLWPEDAEEEEEEEAMEEDEQPAGVAADAAGAAAAGPLPDVQQQQWRQEQQLGPEGGMEGAAAAAAEEDEDLTDDEQGTMPKPSSVIEEEGGAQHAAPALGIAVGSGKLGFSARGDSVYDEETEPNIDEPSNGALGDHDQQADMENSQRVGNVLAAPSAPNTQENSKSLRTVPDSVNDSLEQPGYMPDE